MWLLCSFQGPPRGARRGIPGNRGLSKLNSMLGLELHDVWHHAKARWDLQERRSGWAGQVWSTY
jgi:hypothetical protein